MSKYASVDILVVGAGVLGVCAAYWLFTMLDSTIAIADTASVAAAHTSSRNTGVIHRPFYIDPKKRRAFATAARKSLPLWRSLASDARLPWRQTGTLNVALSDGEVKTLKRYREWGVENGMDEEEMEILDRRGVQSIEPEVSCIAGLHSRTDVSVDFGAFTRHIWRFLISNGVKFLGGHRVTRIGKGGAGREVEFRTSRGLTSLNCRILVNAAGGGGIEIAHASGLGREYATLNFRGEYWFVGDRFGSRVKSNVYSLPRYPQYPFLDPHFIVRADGSRQIGPNAVLVPGPYVYRGLGVSNVANALARPIQPKLKMMANGSFISLVGSEWRSSLFRRAMCQRVRKFIPRLQPEMVTTRGFSGIRSSLIDSSGFVPEAILLKDEASAHILNFNSPGATGAPAYSAMVVSEMKSAGLLGGFSSRKIEHTLPGWRFQSAMDEKL